MEEEENPKEKQVVRTNSVASKRGDNMSQQERIEIINQLVEHTKIRREYYEELSDRRLLDEIDKIQLIY